MFNSKDYINTLSQAAQVNKTNPNRTGNLITLNPPGKVIMTGDIHGNEKNLDRIIRYCDLSNNPNTHLVIHELIHDPTHSNPYECHSYTTIYHAAKLLIKYPGQVHYLMGNHMMAQITEEEVIKSGKPMVKSLTNGIGSTFGDDSKEVHQSVIDFGLSLPLAVRTSNNIFMSHSLPGAESISGFDCDIFDSELTEDILMDNQSIRGLLWDRHHNDNLINNLTSILNAKMFIIGHQPQPLGHSRPFRKLIILASDHNLGCILPFELGKEYSPDELYSLVIKIAKIA